MDLTKIFQLLAGIGTFLLGFKILSENIEKIANTGLKKIFNKISKNRFVCLGIGVLVTAIIQSSTATTVMVVGFVNAGLMNLAQATAVIMGANIGTTITAQIVALGVESFTTYAIVFVFIGMLINIIFKRDRVKTIGLIFAGLGIIFLGLQFMSNSMAGVSNNEAVMNVFKSISNPFLLLLLGIIVTIILQSSSGVTAILISLAGSGIVIGNGGNSIFYVILGTNIGTCLTALLAAIGTHPNAKRASVIHLMFNVFGSVIFFIMLLCFPRFAEVTFQKWFSLPETQIAMFHTFFNVVCTLIFIPFTNLFVKLSSVIVKDKEKNKREIIYMDERLLSRPAVAIEQLRKECIRMGDESIETLQIAMDGFLKIDNSNEEKVRNDIDVVNEMNRQIINYLVQVSYHSLTLNDEVTISNLHHTLADLMRISEVADNVLKYTNSTIKENLEFSDQVMVEIKDMFEKVKMLYKLAIEAYRDKNLELLPKIDKVEEEIDEMRNKLIDEHIKRLNEGKCKPQNSGVFINLVSNLERVADHLTYIAYSIKEEN